MKAVMEFIAGLLFLNKEKKNYIGLSNISYEAKLTPKKKVVLEKNSIKISDLLRRAS